MQMHLDLSVASIEELEVQRSRAEELGAQLRLDGADDPRLELFIEAYGDGHTAPEPNTSCHGGTDDPTGGTGADA